MSLDRSTRLMIQYTASTLLLWINSSLLAPSSRPIRIRSVQNASNLMLKQEIVDAVQAGRFHVWSVAMVEEGVEVLTGQRAGRNEDGTFSPDSVLFKVDERLARMAEELAEFGREGGGSRGSQSNLARRGQVPA